MGNKRLEGAERQIAAANATRDEILRGIEARESSPAFKKAQELFSAGWRLRNWGASLTDTLEEIVLIKDGLEVGYWADGANRQVEEAYATVGISDPDEADEVLEHLSDLTEEE